MGANILARAIKKRVNAFTTQKYKQLYCFEKQNLKQPNKLMDDAFDKHDFLTEYLFKVELVKVLNFLLKLESKSVDSQAATQDWVQRLANQRLRTLSLASQVLGATELKQFLSQGLIRDIMKIPFLEGQAFFMALQYHFQLQLKYDLDKKIKNDKYYFLFAPQKLPKTQEEYVLKYTDIQQILYRSVTYLTLKERACLILIKQSYNLFQEEVNFSKFEIQLPGTLYKIESTNIENSYLNSQYILPTSEVLSDFVIYLELIFNSLYTIYAE